MPRDHATDQGKVQAFGATTRASFFARERCQTRRQSFDFYRPGVLSLEAAATGFRKLCIDLIGETYPEKKGASHCNR
jgi:hypothetical protein